MLKFPKEQLINNDESKMGVFKRLCQSGEKTNVIIIWYVNNKKKDRLKKAGWKQSLSTPLLSIKLTLRKCHCIEAVFNLTIKKSHSF